MTADFNKLYIKSAVAGGSRKIKSMLLNISKNFDKTATNALPQKISLSPPSPVASTNIHTGVTHLPSPFLSPRDMMGVPITPLSVEHNGSSGWLESYCSQLQGRRPYMEDRYVIENTFLDCARSHPSVKHVRDLLPVSLYNEMPHLMSVYGVFDGHGGSNAVNFISKLCIIIITKLRSRYSRNR